MHATMHKMRRNTTHSYMAMDTTIPRLTEHYYRYTTDMHRPSSLVTCQDDSQHTQGAEGSKLENKAD